MHDRRPRNPWPRAPRRTARVGEDAVGLDASAPSGMRDVPRDRLQRGRAGERRVVEHHPLARDAAQLAERLPPVAACASARAGRRRRRRRDRRSARPCASPCDERHRAAGRGGAAPRDRQHLGRGVDAGHLRAARAPAAAPRGRCRCRRRGSCARRRARGSARSRAPATRRPAGRSGRRSAARRTPPPSPGRRRRSSCSDRAAVAARCSRDAAGDLRTARRR